MIETPSGSAAQGAEGRTYYYHSVTMETGWTDPGLLWKNQRNRKGSSSTPRCTFSCAVVDGTPSLKYCMVETPWTKLEQNKPSGPS